MAFQCSFSSCSLHADECCVRMFPDPNLLVCSLNMLPGYLCGLNSSKWCKQHHCKSASCELSLSSHLGACVCSAHVLQSNQDMAVCLQSETAFRWAQVTRKKSNKIKQTVPLRLEVDRDVFNTAEHLQSHKAKTMVNAKGFKGEGSVCFKSQR